MREIDSIFSTLFHFIHLRWIYSLLYPVPILLISSILFQCYHPFRVKVALWEKDECSFVISIYCSRVHKFMLSPWLFRTSPSGARQVNSADNMIYHKLNTCIIYNWWVDRRTYLTSICLLSWSFLFVCELNLKLQIWHLNFFGYPLCAVSSCNLRLYLLL